MDWNNEIRNRLDNYKVRFKHDNGNPISLKIGVYSGCFHREHSPKAYDLIDKELSGINLTKEKIEFIEHESGPEILLWVTAGLAFTTSIINLIVAIIKARSEGIKKGDRPDASIELKVRKYNSMGKLNEENVLNIHQFEKIDKKLIEHALTNVIKKSLKNDSEKGSK